jgi:hypothetical protein
VSIIERRHEPAGDSTHRHLDAAVAASAAPAICAILLRFMRMVHLPKGCFNDGMENSKAKS